MRPIRPSRRFWPFAALPAAGFLGLIAISAGVAEDRPASPRQVSRVNSNASTSRGQTGPVVADEPMIEYYVRFFVVPAQEWRQLLLPRVRLLKQDADCSVWLMDKDGLTRLIAHVQADHRTSVLWEDKVCSHNGAKFSIKRSTSHHYVGGFDDINSPAFDFRPHIDNLEDGIMLRVTGIIRARSTQLSVEATDTALLGMHTMVQEKRIGEQIHAAQYQIPTTAKRGCKVDCDVPEGTQLLISLGLRDKPGSLPDAARLANGVLVSVGLPQIQPAPDTTETLVLITPRHVLPDDAKPGAHSASAGAAASPTRR
jgi:hypothetical protein